MLLTNRTSFRLSLTLAFVSMFVPVAFARGNEVVEVRSAPLSLTTLTTRKTHLVRGPGGKLFGYGLRLSPFVVQNLDGSGRREGIRVKVYTLFPRLTFSLADIVLTIDGRRLIVARFDWEVEWASATSETAIVRPGLLAAIGEAREAYLTVLVPGSGQISFRVSPEQQDDLHLLAGH